MSESRIKQITLITQIFSVKTFSQGLMPEGKNEQMS